MQRLRLIRRALVVLAAMTVVVASPGIATAEPSPASPFTYTMVGFSNTNARSMDVYQSSDGTNFQVLKKGAYSPPTGMVRDPSIFRHTDGQYYITYTTADGANIGFARSSDRITWTPMRNWPLPLCCAFLPGTGDGKGPSLPFPFDTGSAGFKGGPSLSPFVTKSWAPEWFIDGNTVNIIVSLSTGGGFVPYLLTALNSSLTSWSWPTLLTGLNADRIDTTIVKVGSTYHAFTKNETKKVIEHAVAPSLRGPYSFVAPGNWGSFVEGPELTQLPNGDWRLFMDAYTKGKYLYSDSADGLKTWSDPKELPGLSGTVRHAGVMREGS